MRTATLRTCIAAAALLAALPAAAQEWPSKPIRLMVGFGAGGGTDIVARIIAQPLTEALGKQVYVENKPGAGGTIAAGEVARAAPDGHTLFMMNNGHAVSAVTYKSLPFDSAKDFQPVAMVATMPLLFLASPSLGASDLKGMIALAKQKPGTINFASVGLGSTQHFAGELLRQLAGVDIVHVPYRGTPAAITAVRQGEAQLLVEVAGSVIGQVRGNELRPLAITSASRFQDLPEVGTVAEAGVGGYDVTTWYALAFPAGTPAPVVAKMNQTVRAALRQEPVRKQMANAVFIPHDGGTPEALGRHVEAEIAKWRGVMEKAGMQPQ